MALLNHSWIRSITRVVSSGQRPNPSIPVQMRRPAIAEPICTRGRGSHHLCCLLVGRGTGASRVVSESVATASLTVVRAIPVEKLESACKPGSVEDGHSSGIAVTGDLKRPTRKHGGTPAAPRGATSLFGLAPGGVCRAAECCHRRGALLPHRFTLASTIAGASAVCFLLHFPSAHAAQALPGTSSAGARTFLHISREMQRPSGRLRGAP